MQKLISAWAIIATVNREENIYLNLCLCFCSCRLSVNCTKWHTLKYNLNAIINNLSVNLGLRNNVLETHVPCSTYKPSWNSHTNWLHLKTWIYTACKHTSTSINDILYMLLLLFPYVSPTYIHNNEVVPDQDCYTRSMYSIWHSTVSPICNQYPL